MPSLLSMRIQVGFYGFIYIRVLSRAKVYLRSLATGYNFTQSTQYKRINRNTMYTRTQTCVDGSNWMLREAEKQFTQLRVTAESAVLSERKRASHCMLPVGSSRSKLLPQKAISMPVFRPYCIQENILSSKAYRYTLYQVML